MFMTKFGSPMPVQNSLNFPDSWQKCWNCMTVQKEIYSPDFPWFSLMLGTLIIIWLWNTEIISMLALKWVPISNANIVNENILEVLNTLHFQGYAGDCWHLREVFLVLVVLHFSHWWHPQVSAFLGGELSWFLLSLCFVDQALNKPIQ